MLVRAYMSPNPVTVRPESDFLAAVAILKAGRFRSLPVVTSEGKLVGILTDRDVAAASPPTVGEGSPKQPDYYGVSLTVDQVMDPDPVTIGPQVPLEEAALVMLHRRVDRLLIVDEGSLAGIITYSDIFRQLITILGGGSDTTRVTVEVDNTPGQLALLARAVADAGGNIISVATASTTERRWAMTMRVTGVEWAGLTQAISCVRSAKVLHACGADVRCAP